MKNAETGQKLLLRWIWAAFIATHILYAVFSVQIDPFLKRDPFHGDAKHFHEIAVSLANGGAFELDNHRAPLFPLMVAGVYKITGPQPQIIRVINALFIIFGAAFLAPFIRRRFNENVFLWFLVFYAAHPMLFHITGWLYTEPLTIFLFCMLVWAYDNARLNAYPLKWLFLLGLLIGGLALSRSAFLGFAGAVIIWILYDAPVNRKLTVGTTLILCLIAVIAPWTWRNYNVYNAFVPVALPGYSLWACNNDMTDGRYLTKQELITVVTLDGKPQTIKELERKVLEAEPERYVFARDNLYRRIAIEWILSNPVKFLALLPKKLYFTLAPISYSMSVSEKIKTPIWAHVLADTWFGLFLLGSIIGFVKTWKAQSKNGAMFWILALVSLFSVLVFNGTSRYLLPIAPGMCLYLSAWITSLKR